MKAVQFLVDEDLPRSAAAVVRRFGHGAADVRDVGLRGATDRQIISCAKERNLCLISGIVVLRIRRDSTARSIVELLEAFLQKADVVAAIAGKLAIVEPGRLRVRS